MGRDRRGSSVLASPDAAGVVGIAGVVAATVALAWRVEWRVPSTLWLDDAWLALSTRASGAGELVMTGVTAPGFAALVRLVHGATGWIEELVTVSAVLALAVPAATAAVTRRVLRLPWSCAVVAAGVSAASPALATAAWRVKPFALDVLLDAGLLALAAGVRRQPGGARRWIAFAAGAAAAFAVSAATAITAAGAGAVLLVVWGRKHVAVALPPLAVGAAFAAAWWAVVVRPATTPALREYWEDYTTVARAPDAAAALLPVAGWFGLVILGIGAALAARADAPLAALLAAPFVVAAAAGASGVVPFGGGRTDLHLLPGVAMLLAVAAGSLPRAAGPALAGAAVLVAPAAERYPAEDLRPLVAVVDAEAGPDDEILVYSAARWAYALTTDGDVDLVRDRSSANGFDARPLDARVTVLRPGGATPVDADGDVWLLVTHGGDDVARIRSDIAAAGFALVATEQRPGADLTRWHRETP